MAEIGCPESPFRVFIVVKSFLIRFLVNNAFSDATVNFTGDSDRSLMAL